MAKTLFERLIARELPCHIVYETEDVFAFLDIEPIAHGHVLVIPKEPAPTMDALSEPAAAALGAALPRLCRAVLAATGTTAYNLLQNNGQLAHQAVPHVHVHIIPRAHRGEGLGVSWNPKPLQQAGGETLAQAIRHNLSRG